MVARLCAEVDLRMDLCFFYGTNNSFRHPVAEVCAEQHFRCPEVTIALQKAAGKTQSRHRLLLPEMLI